MKIRDEIAKYAAEEDKPCLNWLFDKWHMSSEWYSNILAICRFEKHGTQSYQSHRVWVPTTAGRILYENLDRMEATK